MKKYGESANLPRGSSKRGGNNTRGRRPLLPPARRRLFSLPPCGGGSGWGVHESWRLKSPQPHLDEMHGPESLPYRPGRAAPRKPSPDDIGAGSGSKIFQPTDSRQSGPNSAPPRAPPAAHRGTGVDGRSASGPKTADGIFRTLQLCDLRGRGFVDFISRRNYRLLSWTARHGLVSEFYECARCKRR